MSRFGYVPNIAKLVVVKRNSVGQINYEGLEGTGQGSFMMVSVISMYLVVNLGGIGAEFSQFCLFLR